MHPPRAQIRGFKVVEHQRREEPEIAHTRGSIAWGREEMGAIFQEGEEMKEWPMPGVQRKLTRLKRAALRESSGSPTGARIREKKTLKKQRRREL